MDYNIHFIEENDLIQFYSGTDPLKIHGLGKMVQILAKLVLSNFNEDFLDWNIGGNLPADAKSNPYYLTSDAAIEELALQVLERVKKQYLKDQEPIENLDERLASMTLRRAYIDWEQYRGVIEYNVVAESGKEAVIRMLAD